MYNFIIMYPLILISFLVSLLCFAIYTIRRRFRHHHIYNHSPTDHIVTLNTNHSIPNNNNNNNNIYNNNNKTTGDEEREKKKKKKKRRKKKQGLVCDHELVKEDKDLVCCLYPFTWSSSATQRRIKQQYDQLVKSHESNGLTLLQVGQFVNCLIEAENELKHKSGVIHRKFTITKALLIKADRSSFDRLRQQIYKLELEQKRLEEDACVYNWLQQQFKLSPAYKKMLEVGAYVESKAKSVDATEDSDSDIFDISFEELLAKEKKDSFWKKKGKPKSGSR